VTGAGEGNRTLVVSLEGFCSTIELHPLDELLAFQHCTHSQRVIGFSHSVFARESLVEEAGFEPA
jgi:hypothetical protein